MKIPDDVFETRCRYCRHGRPQNGNEDIPARALFESSYRDRLSCNIFGIARCDKVPGECLSFSPYLYFGICLYCKHNNMFREGFCSLSKQPNKRQVFLGHGGLGDAHQPNYWMEHGLSTCDKYVVDPYWVDDIIKAVAKGRSPANFDPVTLKPLERCEASEVVAKWLEVQAQAREEREKATVANRATVQQAEPEDDEQLSLFDTGVVSDV